MRLQLLTAGSRGDVEPFAALARAAQDRGHEVRLGLPDHSDVDVSVSTPRAWVSTSPA